MKQRFLFPYWSRYLGIAFILLHIPLMLVRKVYEVPDYNQPFSAVHHGLFNIDHLLYIIAALLMLIGLLLVAFSKEKIEDEQIWQLRLDSLQWAVYLNYAILIISLIATNGNDFRDILYLNLWVPLVFFIVRFRWVIYRLNRSLTI